MSHAILRGTVIVVLILFVAVPVGIAAWERAWEPPKAVLGAVALLFPIWAMWKRRRPVTYTPDRVPRDLLP